MDARFFCACGRIAIDAEPPPRFPSRYRFVTDELILGFDRALRTLSGAVTIARPNPGAARPECALSEAERRHAAGLMRVNHSGEICAQALYHAQSLTARDPATRHRLAEAARE